MSENKKSLSDLLKDQEVKADAYSDVNTDLGNGELPKEETPINNDGFTPSEPGELAYKYFNTKDEANEITGTGNNWLAKNDYRSLINDESIITFSAKISKEDVRDYVKSLLTVPGNLRYEEFTPVKFANLMQSNTLSDSDIKMYFPSTPNMINNGTGVRSILIFETQLNYLSKSKHDEPKNFVEEALETSPEKAFDVPNADKIFGKNNSKCYIVRVETGTAYFLTNTVNIILGTVNVDLAELEEKKITISIGESGDKFFLHFKRTI